MVADDETVTRGGSFHYILRVSREEQHLASCSRRKLGPGEEWTLSSGADGDSCF